MKIDLSPFTSQDDTRPSLNHPWKLGEYVYATDGRVMIRVLAMDYPECKENAEAPKTVANMFIAVFDKMVGKPVYRKLPADIPPSVFIDCPVCKGKGCEDCDWEKREPFCLCLRLD